MAIITTPASQDTNAQPEPGPRYSTCEQVKLDEWINWQKCWSDPYVGVNGESRILAHPIGLHPIMLLLHSPATTGNFCFWWFFVCNRCRIILRLRGLRTERKEVEDRRILVPLSGPGPHDIRVQLWPTLVEQNWTRNIGINDQFGVSDYWSRPSSPASSLGSNPWAGHLDDYGDSSDEEE